MLFWNGREGKRRIGRKKGRKEAGKEVVLVLVLVLVLAVGVGGVKGVCVVGCV